MGPQNSLLSQNAYGTSHDYLLQSIHNQLKVMASIFLSLWLEWGQFRVLTLACSCRTRAQLGSRWHCSNSWGPWDYSIIIGSVQYFYLQKRRL